ncbi:putative Sulfotransferase domain, P-loop containing nucleoside triphosphate hydrolase [Helianthus anomalus]
MVGYWHESLKNPENVYFLTYEEMKEQQDLHLRKLADFLGCPFSPKEVKENMVNKEGKLPSDINNSAFFRKGEVGDWKNYLTTEMVKRLDKICEEKLDGSGVGTVRVNK